MWVGTCTATRVKVGRFGTRVGGGGRVGRAGVRSVGAGDVERELGGFVGVWHFSDCVVFEDDVKSVDAWCQGSCYI